MSINTSQVPVETFYHDRSEYAIIGLTGVAGSGCSKFAELLQNPQLLFEAARKPEDFVVNYPEETNSEKQKKIKNLDVNASLESFVTKKKYEICYNYLMANYQAYDVIKYTKLLWLYLLLYSKHCHQTLNDQQLAACVETVLADKFKPSVKHDKELKEAIGYTPKERAAIIHGIVDTFKGWTEIADKLNSLNNDWVEKKFQPSEPRDLKKELYLFFEEPVFCAFVEYFTNELARVDYYSSCFYYHRFATEVRSNGNPFTPYDEWFNNDDKGCENLYVIIRLFVLLLDGKRENGGHRRVVIDSIRNSAEALYLRERYSGFYLVAIHDENSITHLDYKIRNLYAHHKYSNEVVSLFYKSLLKLNKVEAEQDDFEKGIFSSPDTDRVIERSEIHIQNIWGMPEDPNNPLSLRYMAEQWVHYAALILHPGIVTPTTAERCMAVAYTAKLNSGCLSRQVGAAITNKDGSVRSIGWNEVPHGQVSCSLRTIDGIENTDDCARCSYSEFEIMGTMKYKDGKSFIQKLKEDYGENLSGVPAQLHGLPFSYCFKSLHNLYEGEKNQVFTRSLHAEENAIIQMSKYGGEALKDGIIYVTASPCELCSKKLYQIGVRQIVYIDPYPGIARQHIISAGFKQPDLKIFEGAIGPTYFKLYQPFMPYKDEVSILTGGKHGLNSSKTLLKKMLKELGVEEQPTYTDAQIEEILAKLKEK